ncbi:MAG: BrnT family toxin [Vicinamibacterales bacterium]
MHGRERLAVLFAWDPKKAARNLRKHGVAFDEAQTVFKDPLARVFADRDHSVFERRELIVGKSGRGRLLIVGFTERSRSVRLVFARRLTRTETHDYEEDR